MAVNKSSKNVSVVTKTDNQSLEANLVSNIPKRTGINADMVKKTRTRRARIRKLKPPNTTAATNAVEQSVASYVATKKTSRETSANARQTSDRPGRSVRSRIEPKAKLQTKRAKVGTSKKQTDIAPASRKRHKQESISAKKVTRSNEALKRTKKTTRKHTSKRSAKVTGQGTKTTKTQRTSSVRTKFSSTPVSKTRKTKIADVQTLAKTKRKTRKTSAEASPQAAPTKSKLIPKKTLDKSKSKAISARKESGKKTTKQTRATSKRSVKVSLTSKPQTVVAKQILTGSSKLADESNEDLIIGFQGIYYKPYEISPKDLFMSVAQQDHFMDILTRAKEKLIAEEAGRATQLQENDTTNLPDPLDQGANEGVFHNQLRTRDRESQLVRKINRAIDCIRTGSYGYCEACGCEIPIRRLEARPIVTKCIDCKERDELRERQLGQ